MKFPKLLLLSVSLLVLLGSIPVFAGAGRQATGPSANEAAILNPVGHIPILRELTTLRIGMVRNPFVQDYATNFQTRELEKDSNIRLEFIFYGATNQDATQRIELEFAAGGRDLPDILNINFSTAAAQFYGEQGLIIRLDDYVQNSLSYSKSSIDELGYDPWRYIRTPDGHIYTLFNVQQELASDIFTRLYTNRDWMNIVGRGMPNDINEFADLLRAFRDHRFNNDGTREFAFIADRGTTLSHRFFNALITPFVYANNTDNYLYRDAQGQISAMYAANAYRDALIYIRGLVDEGLIDPLSFTQDGEQLRAIANQTSNHSIGMTTMYPANFYPLTDPRFPNWVLVNTLGGPAGRVASFSGIRLARSYAVTRNSQYPEASFRLGDMIMSEKYSMITRYGEEGVDRIPPPPGTLSFYPEFAVTHIPILDWNTPNNKRWESNQPYIFTYRMSASVAAVGHISGLEEWTNVMAAESLQFVQRDREIGPINYTTREFEDIAEIMANLNTYWIESFVRFVVRDMSIENDWNRYQNELRAIGLENYINITRAAYNRMRN